MAEIQFKTAKKLFERDLTTKSSMKKVHFKSGTPAVIPQAFENIELNEIETNERYTNDFEDNDFASSSTSIFTSDLIAIPDETVCDGRRVATTFIIVVLIILIVAATVGIVFGALNTGEQNSTANANQYSVSTVSSAASRTLITSNIIIGNQTGAPCSSYTTIDDPSRSIMNIGYNRACDQGPLFNSSNSNGAWIRFVGSGGSIMASSTPGKNHCGAYLPVWFNGTLPTTQGTMADGEVVLSSEDSLELYAYNSTVYYCTGGYYIYFLEPVMICNARYCTM